MKVIHIELKQANEFVDELHRHHKPVRGHRFSLGAMKGDKLVGVVIVGRPVARAVDYRKILEITRLCTDGSKNACSFLYAAAARAGKALGYEKIQTYILQEETGTSLTASGWTHEVDTKGGDWNNGPFEGRRTDQPQGPKKRYAKQLMDQAQTHKM